MKSSRVYEMFWDCSSCGTRKLLGKTHRYCAECGAPQDPKTRYFPEEHEKVAVHDHVYHGVDLTCAHCQMPNSAAAQFCVRCGAPIGDSDDVPVALIRDKPKARRAQSRAAGGWARWWARCKAFFWHRHKKLTVILGVLTVITLAVLVTIFWTRSAILEVRGHTWKRSISIDRLKATHESSWCDSMPYDAYSVSRSTRQRSTNKIPEGESCSTRNVDNGDGTYQQVEECHTVYREEPVYDDYCDYTVDRWRYERSVVASGGLNDTPYWPATGVSSCSSLGCEREGGRSETYTVHFVEQDSGDKHGCAYSPATWRSMEVSSLWQAEIRVITGGMVCDTAARIDRRQP